MDTNSQKPEGQRQQPALAFSGNNTGLNEKGKGRSTQSDQAEFTRAPGDSSDNGRGLMGSIAASAKTVVSALDPRQPDAIRQPHGLGSGLSSAFSDSTGSKQQASSSAGRAFQNANTALETIESSVGSSSRGRSNEPAPPQPMSFRQTESRALGGQVGGEIDWDNFLASAESTLPEDVQPYKPPSFESFGSSLSASAAPSAFMHQRSGPVQGPLDEFDGIYQSHLSQPLTLTPANHVAFLEYLKSTSSDSAQLPMVSSSSSSSSTLSSATTPSYSSFSGSTFPSQPPALPLQYRPQHQAIAPPLFSNDVQRQQQMDGSQVFAFLESTSYSDFVDQVDAEGIDRHQDTRRQFVYSETMLGPGTQSLYATLQLIQNMPSERQDILQYLMQQGTYADDVWSRPFAHDVVREEAASLAATRAEQDQFLERQLQQQHPGGATDNDATTQEMERVLRQILDDAKAEVKTGETKGKALNRLTMVRNHITMGAKL